MEMQCYFDPDWTEPYIPFTELALDAMSDEFYDSNEKWIEEAGGQLDHWLERMYRKDCEPRHAGVVIERAARIYCKLGPHE